jgi:hypothetical protein
MNTGMMIAGILFYVLAAAWFISMGVGSMLARRWARALILVSSWIWLLAGVMGLGYVVGFMPDMFDKMSESGQMPADMVTPMKFVMIGFIAVIYLVIPGALVLFYGSRHVKATCEFRDPKVRWTDRCPLPVLALSLMYGLGALAMPMAIGYGGILPLFGYLLSGAPGILALLAVAVLMAYLAWGTYRLKLPAWWAAMGFTVLFGISGIVTFLQIDMMEMYERMGMPAQQLEIIEQYGVTDLSGMALGMGLWTVGLVGFLLYVRRYFVPSTAQLGDH